MATEILGPVEAAETDLAALRSRLDEIRAEESRLDTANEEAKRAVGVAVAEEGVVAAESLSEAQAEISVQLDALTAGRLEVQTRIHVAEKRLGAARRGGARGVYVEAREAEEAAIHAAAKAGKAFAAALDRLTEAGRAAYAAGNAAGLEGPAHYKRRLSVRGLWVAAALGAHLPESRPTNAQARQAGDLVARMRQVVPPPPSEEE